jgi:Skp family chaperone for outer membrane proteins
MKKHGFEVLVPGILAASVLALAMGVGAQTPPAPEPLPAAKSPMAGRHMDSAAGTKHDADMKAECQAMMAKKQEMHEKLKAADATLDKLVAEMNAAEGSKQVDAMEKSMAAVINELVAQRKVSRSMMEAQPAMMGHMMHHMGMPGPKGATECPMMKTSHAPEPRAEEKKPSM